MRNITIFLSLIVLISCSQEEPNYRHLEHTWKYDSLKYVSILKDWKYKDDLELPFLRDEFLSYYGVDFTNRRVILFDGYFVTTKGTLEPEVLTSHPLRVLFYIKNLSLEDRKLRKFKQID